MRILVASDLWFPDHRGGAARVARDTARELAARGHEVTVLTPVSPGSPSTEELDGVTLLRELPRNRLPHLVTDVVSSRRIARHVARHDVLLAHQVTVACGLLLARTRLPLVVVRHGSPVREARLEASQLPRGAHRARRAAAAYALGVLEKEAVSRAQRVIVLSRYMSQLLIEDYPSAAARVRVAHGGVDADWLATQPEHATARESLGVGRDEALVLAVRRLERGLGLETALEAFRLVLEQRGATLAIVGDGSLAPRLQALGAELGLGGRLRLVGAQDGAALRTWYRAADVFLLPPAPHEGFGMATIEALASGTPPVVARVGSNAEILEPLEPRLVASSDAPGHMAETLIGALDLAGPDLRRRCREYAAERFTWGSVIEGWETALTEAAGAEAAPTSPP